MDKGLLDLINKYNINYEVVNETCLNLLQDGLKPESWPEEIKYTMSENGEVLVFTYIRMAASGAYACTAKNRNGSDTSFLAIEVEGMC